MNLRARAHARYLHPTPEQRKKIEAKIERLIKEFSEMVTEPEEPRAKESGTPFESLPKQTPAAAPIVRRPGQPIPPPPSRKVDDRGLFPLL